MIMATSNICQNLPKYECSQATTPSGQNNKAGWYDIHEKHSKLARFSQSSSVILCGDSIVAGLSRYPKVWNRFFKPWKALSISIKHSVIEPNMFYGGLSISNYLLQ